MKAFIIKHRKAILIAVGVLVMAQIVALTVGALSASPQTATQNKPQPTDQTITPEKPHADPFDPIHADSAPVAEIQAAERPQELPKSVETYQQPSQPAAQPAAPQQTTAAANPKQGGHIPFTNEPVTAGDPQSYVGTVGQCPFYEIAGDKGCVPPPDIECNADWSVCKLKVLE